LVGKLRGSATRGTSIGDAADGLFEIPQVLTTKQTGQHQPGHSHGYGHEQRFSSEGGCGNDREPDREDERRPEAQTVNRRHIDPAHGIHEFLAVPTFEQPKAGDVEQKENCSQAPGRMAEKLEESCDAVLAEERRAADYLVDAEPFGTPPSVVRERVDHDVARGSKRTRPQGDPHRRALRSDHPQ
jgi:hypothetical protein